MLWYATFYMRFLVLCLFVMALSASPAFLLDSTVMPQIQSLEHTYANADKIAENAAEGASSHSTN
jgi:hypothetical protein